MNAIKSSREFARLSATTCVCVCVITTRLIPTQGCDLISTRKHIECKNDNKLLDEYWKITVAIKTHRSSPIQIEFKPESNRFIINKKKCLGRPDECPWDVDGIKRRMSRFFHHRTWTNQVVEWKSKMKSKSDYSPFLIISKSRLHTNLPTRVFLLCILFIVKKKNKSKIISLEIWPKSGLWWAD